MANYYFATQESVTGGVMCGVGDAVCGSSPRALCLSDSKKRNDIDIARIMIFALKGLVGGIIWS